MNERKPGGEAFNEPPTDTGRGSASADYADYEEASHEFVPPAEGDTEAAAMAEPADGIPGASAELLEVKRAIEEKLRSSVTQAAGAQTVESFQGAGNIQGVGIGISEGVDDALGTAGPGAPGITLYVAEPMTADEAKAVVVEAMGVQAAASDDVPVNVVVTGLIDAQPHRFRIRPAPGGVSIAHFKVTAGTLGCLARGRTAPRNARLMLLSNNHVVANSNNAVFGDCICQPGPYDGGKCPQDQIAILERFVPINFSGGANYVDCGTGWCWPDRVRRELVYLSGGSVRLFRISSTPVAPALGMIVGKTGRTTQLTAGRITGVGVTIRVNYGGGRVALFVDQIAIHPYSSGGTFSAGGDSGSSIWTWNASRNPVGLLFAGGGGVTFGNRMTRVVSALDIVLYT